MSMLSHCSRTLSWNLPQASCRRWQVSLVCPFLICGFRAGGRDHHKPFRELRVPAAGEDEIFAKPHALQEYTRQVVHLL